MGALILHKLNVMINVITDVPSNVIGFRISGEVKKDDYKNTVLPELNKHLSDHDKVSVLWVMDTDVGNYTLSSMFEDLKVSISNLSNWKSVAIVSDQEFLKGLAETAGFILPGEIKGFKNSQLEEAKQWVSKQ